MTRAHGSPRTGQHAHAHPNTRPDCPDPPTGKHTSIIYLPTRAGRPHHAKHNPQHRGSGMLESNEHRSCAGCATACSVAAITLLQATVARGTHEPAVSPAPPAPHAASTTGAASAPPAHLPEQGTLPYDASPYAKGHTDPATDGSADPTADDHPGPTTDAHASATADGPTAPGPDRPRNTSNSAPIREPRSRDTHEPATPPTPAHTCTTSTLAALAAIMATLALALDARPHTARRPGAPRRVVRRTAAGSLALAGTLLVATMTRRAMGARASSTPAPGDDTRRYSEDTDGAPIDLSNDAPDDGPPDHDDDPDPPPAQPPLTGIAECLKDAIEKDL